MTDLKNTHCLFARVLPLSLLLAQIVPCGSNAQILRYHLVKGSTYRYMIEFDTKISSRIGEREMKKAFSGPAWISLTVDSLGQNGEFFCSARLDSVRGMLDSTTRKDPVIRAGFLGKNVRLTFNRFGKPVKTTALDSLPRGVETMAWDQINPIRLLPTVLLPLPEREVTVGDSWDVPREDSLSFLSIRTKMEGNTKCKISGKERFGGYDCLKILIEGKGTMDSRGRGDFASHVTTKTSGTAYFAPKEGILVQMEHLGTVDISSTGKQIQSTSTIVLNRKISLVR